MTRDRDRLEQVFGADVVVVTDCSNLPWYAPGGFICPFCDEFRPWCEARHEFMQHGRGICDES